MRLLEEQLDLLGKPMPRPADVEPRFSGPALAGSVTQAIGQSGVVGNAEQVDCSEYPCIVFGRLVGGGRPRETGLFAIAFYTADDRASMGAELDRRIRARTVEYWNTDKPGRPDPAAVD
jgi:hypothetical protein